MTKTNKIKGKTAKNKKAVHRDADNEKERLERELAYSKHEIKRLQRENEYLTHRIHTLSPKEEKGVPHEEELFFRSDEIDSSRGYFGYLIRCFKLTFVYKLYDRTFFAIRKYLAASKIWKNFLIILAFFGTSIQAVLTFGSVLVILPATLAVAAVFGILSYFFYRRERKKLLAATEGKKIFFVYARKKKRGEIFYDTLSVLAEKGTVLVVTSSFSLCGFSVMKKHGENIYFIHTSFYFGFDTAALKRDSSKIVKIY